ncbi:hypothetical protein Vretimale_18485 [Volvox reticuliferus]|nr:hypothetical protein Vretimale_18485 [Volvox reticuliferus]
MADVLGLIMSISELCSIAANKVQDVRDIEKDCIELNALLRRLKQLLDDAVVELDEQQLNKASAIEALEALKGTMQLCLDVITDLSKKSWLWKLLRSGEHVASIKSVTLQISRDLTTLNTALGMEQHADLKRAMKKLQIDLENVSLKVMRGFQAQAAQLQEQFEQVRKELNANGPTSTAAKDPVALLSNAVGILDSSKSVRPKATEEICAALREEMESMRREKQNMHEGYLSQLMEAYSLVAKGSLSSGPSTSAPWAHSAQVAELEVPDEYRCPITLRVMSDPVKLVESGHSFERTAIEMHLSSSCINPLTQGGTSDAADAEGASEVEAVSEGSREDKGRGRGLQRDQINFCSGPARRSWRAAAARTSGVPRRVLCGQLHRWIRDGSQGEKFSKGVVRSCAEATRGPSPRCEAKRLREGNTEVHEGRTGR